MGENKKLKNVSLTTIILPSEVITATVPDISLRKYLVISEIEPLTSSETFICNIGFMSH